MNYKVLNKKQKHKMKAITNAEYIMEWEAPEFMNYLLGELPKVIKNHSYNDKEIESKVTSLEKIMSAYNAFSVDKSTFLKDIEKAIIDIHKTKDSWSGLNLYEVEKYIKIHQFCLISGEGGVGKSFFIKCFEDQLEQKNIEHLCIYGKFEKSTNNINVREIVDASSTGFVFIVDAINEMSYKGQQDLLDILTELKKYPQIRIVISYRTNSMDNEILKKYQDLSEYEYKFPGVSFESALNEILKSPVPDVYMYEDILYSNNALLLSMLCDILSSTKIVNETENGIASITFILEQYIKKTTNKILKNNANCQGIDIWNDTKEVAKWMYKNEKKYIDEKNLFLIIKTGKNFISSMMQMNFMYCYEINNEKYYSFTIDSLSDFLIARSLFEDIKKKTYNEQVDIIKSKSKSLYNLEEALIIAIFDNYSPNYKTIKDFLCDTELIDRINISTLVKVHFKQESIPAFLETFESSNHNTLLEKMGGYVDKPFNCSNHLFDYYSKNNTNLCELSNTLSGYHFKDELKQRLKNVLYFTTLNDREDRRDEEAFYFGLLCCAAPNTDIRCLAEKLLYDITSKNENYIDRLIAEYNSIPDFYIQESIIFVLSQMKKGNNKILEFYNYIIKNQDNLTAKSIRRISIYFDKPYSYINWSRKNLYKYNKDATVSDYLNDILFSVDIMNKDFLPFRYWGKDHIDMFTHFLATNKSDIEKINNYLNKNYSCIINGKCNGLMSFERNVMPEIKSIATLEPMDIDSFLESYESVFKYVFKYYNIEANKDCMRMAEKDFINSTYMKCIDISTDLYYGSLMCNYYTNEFTTYNNTQNSIGYEVYDPLKYGENTIITSPIPTHQSFIEILGDYLISALEMPSPRDTNWVTNVELTRRNVLHLLEPIEFKHQDWIVLACRIYIHEDENFNSLWTDAYNLWCCTSENVTINDDGNARYLTIELEDYLGNLNAYQDNTINPWLCKSIQNISSTSNILDETSLVLPPSEIISYFNLSVNISDLSWENQKKEKIIICNNNKNSFYRNPIGRTVFIRKDYYEKYLETHTIKYFVFTERQIPKTGFADETSLHFEIIDGKIVKEIKNYNNHSRPDNNYNPLCSNCPHTHLFTNNANDSSDFNKSALEDILSKYGQ